MSLETHNINSAENYGIFAATYSFVFIEFESTQNFVYVSLC